ncbi:hypothetical protein [Asaia platycodi]|uniref:hypothetical protein n=1 Tax=Asaia platycodi TaxID=610243 RepID=UPI00131EFB25|nr:hypothetical protein [Asaia platycodi]
MSVIPRSHRQRIKAWAYSFSFRTSRLRGTLLIMGAFAATPPCLAESFHEAIQSAWDRDPANQSFAIDAKASARNARAARSWFPDGPIVAGQYLDDHFIGTNLATPPIRQHQCATLVAGAGHGNHAHGTCR